MLSLHFDPVPVLQTNRLILREMMPEDAQALFRLRSSSEINQYMDRHPHQKIAETEDLIQQIRKGYSENSSITWAICLQEDATCIGTIGFWKIMPDHHRAEIGYLLATEFQGKGIMQEALEKVISFGFETMKLHSIEAQINPGHKASKKLLERNGFVLEAYFKESYFFNGQYLDTVVFSLLNNTED